MIEALELPNREELAEFDLIIELKLNWKSLHNLSIHSTAHLLNWPVPFARHLIEGTGPVYVLDMGQKPVCSTGDWDFGLSPNYPRHFRKSSNLMTCFSWPLCSRTDRRNESLNSRLSCTGSFNWRFWLSHSQVCSLISGSPRVNKSAYTFSACPVHSTAYWANGPVLYVHSTGCVVAALLQPDFDFSFSFLISIFPLFFNHHPLSPTLASLKSPNIWFEWSISSVSTKSYMHFLWILIVMKEILSLDFASRPNSGGSLTPQTHQQGNSGNESNWQWRWSWVTVTMTVIVISLFSFRPSPASSCWI